MFKQKNYLALGAVVLVAVVLLSLPTRATSRLKLAVSSWFLPLFGLAGALILGFLDLTAGQAQNRFFNELEEVRTLFAQLINAAADDVAVVPASSYAAAIAGLNVPLRKGQTVIVLSREHFSSV